MAITSKQWLCTSKSNKLTSWLISVIVIISLLLGEKCVYSTTSLLDDFPPLGFDNKLLITDDNLEHIVEDSLKEFQSNLRRELGLTPNSIISSNAESLPFEPEDDFYFYNNINTDSGAAEQKWINYMTVGPNQSFPSNLQFLDLDTIKFGGNVLTWVTTDKGLIVIEHPLNGHEIIKQFYNIELRGLIACEPVILFNTATSGEELIIFVLRQHERSQSLDWYTWNAESYKLHFGNTIQMEGFTSNIKHVRIPITGSHMIASLQKNAVAMYLVDVQDGVIRLKLCNEIAATEATDVVSFSINGQLYMAVGNGGANMSYIWKYRIQKEDFEFHQSLEDVNITDLEYFHRGYEYYLAVVAVGKAVIYRWEGALFLRIQNIAMGLDQAPARWHSIHHKFSYPKDVTILLISANNVTNYVWNKYFGQFILADGTECIFWTPTNHMRGTMFPPHVHNMGFEETKDTCVKQGKACSGIVFMDMSWYLVVLNSKTDKLITGNIYQKLVQSANMCWPKLIKAPISVVSFAIDDECYRLVTTSGKRFSYYKLYAASRPIPTPSSFDMPDLQALENKLKEQEIALQKVINALEERQFSEKILEHEVKPNLETVCPDVEARLRKLADRVEDVQKKQLLSGHKTMRLNSLQRFGSVNVLGETIINGNARVKYINNLDMRQFFQNSVMKKIPTRIRGTKTFLGKTTIEGNLKVSQRLNGHRVPDDYIFLNQPQDIADTEFQCLAPVSCKGDLNVLNHVNGFDLSKEAVLLHHHEPQHLTGSKQFTANVSVVEPLIVNKRVNNVNIVEMAADTVTSRVNISIKGFKTFTNNVTINKHVISKTVKSLDIKRIEETTVKINEPTVVVAPKVFTQNVVIGGIAQLKTNSINGLRIPNDFVLSNDSKVVMDGHKQILGKVTILGNLTVGGKLDGIDLKDVVFTKGNQTLCGIKKFTNAVFSNLRYHDTDSDVDASNAVVHGNLRIVDKVNGMKLNELYDDLIFKNESRVVFKAPVTFAKPQLLSESEIQISGLINNLNMTEDFVHSLSLNKEITGNKIFMGPATFNCDLLVRGTFDGINLTEFSHEVVRLEGPPQTIHGAKTFVNGASIVRLTDLSDSDEILHMPITTKALKVKGSLDVTGKINGVDFKQLTADRLTLSTDQAIYGSLWMSDVNKVKNLRVSGTLNQVNLSRLWNDILWKNARQEQVVTGRKQFKGKVQIPSLVARQGINGLAIEDVHEAAIYLQQGAINGSYTFADSIEVEGSLTISGRINGVDFNALVKDTVLKSHPQLVTGVKVFESLRIKGSLLVDGLINGLKLERDVLTVNTPQIITGHYTFSEDVSLTDSAKVICELSTKQVSYSQGDVETVTLRGNVKTDALWTGGNLNGMDFIQFWMDAVHTSDSEVIIAGTKRFLGKVTFTKNVNVLGTINNFNYPLFLRNVVTIDGYNQIITGLKEFTDMVEISHLKCHGKVSIQGKFNNAEINTISALANPVVGSISGNVTIDGSLEIHGNVNFTDTLNDVKIPEDIMTNKSDSVVSGRKISKEIIVKGNIIVNHSVNSYNLSTLEIDTLKVEGDQIVTGQKIFKGGVIFGQDASLRVPNNPYQSNGKRPKGSDQPALPGSSKLTFPMNLKFHGNVLFNQGLTVNDQVYNSRAALEVQPKGPECSMSECHLLDSVWESFNLRTNVTDSLQRIQTERGPFIDAKAELVPSDGRIYLGIGFPGCSTPLNIFAWSPHQQNMLPQGMLDLYSVYKILPIEYKHSGHLLVYHRDCVNGKNLTSLLAFQDDNRPHRVLKQLPSSVPLAVDILVDKENILVAKVDSNNNLVIDKISITGDEVSWITAAVFALPPGLNDVKWLPNDRFGKFHRVVVRIEKRESRVYKVQDDWQVELLQVLNTSGILAFGDASYRQNATVAFAQSGDLFGFIKLYSSDVDLKEADMLNSIHNVSAISLAKLEVGDKLYFVVNYGNQVDIYVKEGASSLLKKLGISVTGVTFAKMFASEMRIYLLMLSGQEWNLSVVLMQGVRMPKINVQCSAPIQ